MIRRIAGDFAPASFMPALFALVALAFAAMAHPAAAQLRAPPPAPVPAGITVEHIKVHGTSLEGNLEGDPVDRNVIVVLPPDYQKDRARRFPVIYFLHGFAIDAQFFFDFMHVPEALSDSAGKGAQFIIVMPDTDTRLGGSMYSDSPTTGDYMAFVAKDLVSYVDSHYRTLARRSSRGLAGHSMGGYGVWRIAMRYPQTWSSIYAMSACCLSPRTTTVDQAKKLAAIPYDKAPSENFGNKASLASMAAWSPDPSKPPYYFDFGLKADDTVDPLTVAKWAANSPLALVSSHVDDLKSFTAVASDGGDKDGLTKDATLLHQQLDGFGVKNTFEVYDGDHTNHIAERFRTKVLPYFAQHLAMK